MESLKLCVFGPPRLEGHGQPIELNLRKAQALLVYLAVSGQPHSRDALATLLWPDRGQSESRARLRRTLHPLQQALGDAILDASPETIRLHSAAALWLDSAAFRQHVTAGLPAAPDAALAPERLAHLHAAIDLYTDDFLAGFTLPDSPAFDEWQFFQRESLRQLYGQVLEQLITAHRAAEAWDTAIPYARRWVALDPLHEPAQRTLIQLYARAGQPAAAARQYQECVRLLDAELGAAPEEETSALYEAIRLRQFAPLVTADRPPIPQPVVTEPALDERYVVEELLASGGQGVVYRGHDRATGQPIAIKRLKPDLVDRHPDALARFMREGAILHQLQHPNIVGVLDTFEHASQYTIVMEYVPGGSLRTLLERERQMSLDRVLTIGLELADALSRAHHLGIIHRDLKPENVLLAADGTPRLSDFGMARLAQDDATLTQSGSIFGSPTYMSPEALRGEALDARSDIWSLGVLLYELLAGQRPFEGAQITPVVASILQDPVPDLEQFRLDVPPPLGDLLRRMLVKERARRLASMRQVAAALEAIRAGGAAEDLPADQRGQAQAIDTSMPVAHRAPSAPAEAHSAGAVGPRPAEAVHEQQIRFCAAPDGVQIAYATVGAGPVLVKAANWLSHLEFDWNSPVWRHWLAGLSAHHTLVRYDERGCGLSDWDVDEFSLEAWVRDLETVVDRLGLERFPLLGISQGGPVAIAYAVRHPEKVSHLILYGTYACGLLKKRNPTPEQLEELETLLRLIKVGWGRDNPAFRQVFTTFFMPEATAEQMHWFNDLQRVSTSPENAVKFRTAFSQLDVQELATRVTTPTLVLHARDDAAEPFEEGRRLAALIPNAQFVPLESQNHILLESEPAWQQFLAAVDRFLGEPAIAEPARNEQPAASVGQYQAYAQMLETGLGAAPAQETTALGEATRARRFPTYTLARPRHNLPAQPTPFIGREQELADLKRLLEQPGCRLLTVVGPGGIGKTRLALAAAAVLDPLADGVFFVALAPLSSAEPMMVALADSLGLQLLAATTPHEQLLTYLRPRRLLLVLDNFEHVLDGAGVLAEILEAAPEVRILATSRERLNLSGETIYRLDGMGYPDPESLRHALEYGAVQLLMQSARMVRPNLEPRAYDLESMARICRLVAGMPLALVLAASWLEVLPFREIADEIARSLDFLETELRDVPERQRSVRAVFESSWNRLPAETQQAFMKLSAFRGGFTLQAAQVVAGASLRTLRTLVNKSFITVEPEERYAVHELLRQYGAEQLRASGEADRTQDAHCDYFLGQMSHYERDLKCGRQLSVLKEIAADLDNIHAAWRHAIERKDAHMLAQAAECFCLFSEMRGSLVEGESAFQQAATAFAPASLDRDTTSLAERQLLCGFLLACQGMLRAHRGSLQAGQGLIEQGLSLLRQFQNHERYVSHTAFALMWLGWTLFLQGSNAQAEQMVRESLDLYSTIGDRWGIAKNLFILGNSLTARGQLTEAEPPLRESLALCQEIADRRSCLLVNRNLAILTFWFGDYAQTRKLLDQAALLSHEFDDQIGLAYTLRELGKLEVAQGDYVQAIKTLQQSIAITDEIGSQWEAAATLDDLGVALRVSGDYATAEQILQQCLAASQALNNRYYTARCLGDLGCVAYHQGDYHQAEQRLQQALNLWTNIGHEPYRAWIFSQLGYVMDGAIDNRPAEARQYYRQALQLATKHNLAPFALDVFVGVAGLLAHTGETSEVTKLLALAEGHVASASETRAKAGRLLNGLSADLSNQVLPEVQAVDQPIDWRAMAKHVIAVLSHPPGQHLSTE